MPVQKGGSGERSQKTEQMSGSKWSLFLQQVEKEGPRPRPSPPLPLLSPAAHGSLNCSRTAQERLRELEAKMERMSATIDKAFKVEMMKMPPSLLKTKMGELLSGGFLAFLSLPCLLCLTSVLVFEEENSSSEVSIALKVSLVMEFLRPLTAGCG